MKGLQISDLPEGITKDQVLGVLWAYDAKPKPRARLVAGGSQEDTTGVDTFSPISKMENVKVVLAIIAQERMDLRLIDIMKAFFKGRLHQPCYIWAPEGLRTPLYPPMPLYYILPLGSQSYIERTRRSIRSTTSEVACVPSSRIEPRH